MYTEHLRIPVGAGSLHAERVGRGGDPVVLIHGFGTCAFLWRAVAPRLASAGYTVLSVDLLGYGESDRPPDTDYGLAAQAEYVERALTALRLPAVSIVGQDIGALVGLLLASANPRRVARLALINPPNPDDLPGPDIRTLQRTSALAALGSNALFGAWALLEPWLRGAVARPDRMPDRLVARYLAPYVGGDGVGQLLQLAAQVDLPADDAWLRSVRAPTLLLHGAADRWTPETSLTALSAGLSRVAVTRETMPEVGHLIAEDAPDKLVATLLRWLSESVAAELTAVPIPAPATDQVNTTRSAAEAEPASDATET